MTRLAEIGQQLKTAREARGRSVEDVAVETHLKGAHLTALEAGDESSLPEPVYIKSFIRKYAQAVGLPAEDLANAYWETRPLPPAPPEAREFHAPWWIFPWIVGVVLLGLLAFAWHLGTRSPASPGGRANPEAIAPSAKVRPASRSIVVPSAGTPHAIATHAASRSGTIVHPHMASPSTRVATPSLHPATKPTPHAAPKPTPHAPPKPAPMPRATPTATVPPAASTSMVPSAGANPAGQSAVLKLHALRASWVRVVRNGHELYSDTMRPGDTKSWPVGSGLSVTIGSASGVQATLGDKALGSLGGEGQVVRRVFR